MRCPPIAVALIDDQPTLLQASRDSSAIPHADPRCSGGCAVLNLIIARILHGDEAPLATALAELDAEPPDGLLTALEPVAAGEAVSGLQTTGYTSTHGRLAFMMASGPTLLKRRL